MDSHSRRADTGDKNWGIARTPALQCLFRQPLICITDRLLMPIFGTGAIRDMFPAMEDIVSQLVTKWERFVSAIRHWQCELRYRFLGSVLTM